MTYSTPSSKHRPVREKRQMIGEIQPQAAPLLPRDYGNLEEHAQGRVESVAQIVTVVAFLRSKGIVSPSDVVESTKAEYQDVRNTIEFPRAHRAPCNVKIRAHHLPDFYSPSATLLRSIIQAPLARTDAIPWIGNLMDSRIESSGMYAAMENLVREVLNEQQLGHSVRPSLVRETIEKRFTPSLLLAIDSARDAMAARIASGQGLFEQYMDIAEGDIDKVIEAAFRQGADPDVLLFDSKTAMEVCTRTFNITRSYNAESVRTDKVHDMTSRMEAAPAPLADSSTPGPATSDPIGGSGGTAVS